MSKEPSLKIGNSKKIQTLRIIRIIGTVICCGGILFGAYNLIKWQVEKDIASEQIVSVQTVSTTETQDTDETEVIISNEDKSNPYWDFIKMSMLDVDFTELKSLNSDTVGWIRVEGTNINYPFVQSSDNDYYLKHTFNRSYNSAGWVYLDYRNNQNLSNNRNTIIYAHGRFDGSMFGTLKNALSSSWQNNQSNQVVKISTPTENSLWQVFSVYRIPTTNDYIKTNFEADNEFAIFATKLKSRSVYDFQTTISPTDKIITLSTCIGTNNNERMVLHAKLIKITPKV